MNRKDKAFEKATFAGGCFWCIEAVFEGKEGVIEATSGYTGGSKENPTYQEVSSGNTGHYEAIQITFDSSKIAYKELLDIYWRHIDPTDPEGQFVDKGPQYRTAIFYHNEEQKRIAMRSKEELEESGKFKKPIVTEILKLTKFYQAEEYHQNYYKKCPVKYKVYKYNSGREKLSTKELKEILPPLQFKVTQEGGTEPPFDNKYWDHKRRGIYVDIVSGEVLFSSLHKFDSGCGWPSFTKPLKDGNIVTKIDTTSGMTRVEVRSKHADSHLGHLFEDGPKPTGLRYCINSASLRFIAEEDLEKEGYGEYKKLFKR